MEERWRGGTGSEERWRKVEERKVERQTGSEEMRMEGTVNEGRWRKMEGRGS